MKKHIKLILIAMGVIIIASIGIMILDSKGYELFKIQHGESLFHPRPCPLDLSYFGAR